MKAFLCYTLTWFEDFMIDLAPISHHNLYGYTTVSHWLLSSREVMVYIYCALKAKKPTTAPGLSLVVGKILPKC